MKRMGGIGIKQAKQSSRKLFETLFFSKEEAERRERVRNRLSYERWNKLLSQHKRTKNIDKILRDVHDFIDEIKGYGHRQTAHWYRESLELVLEDRKGKKK